MTSEEQIQKAIHMLSYSYAPYSNFLVGAALLTENGKLYTGCNVENATYSATICAERTAFLKALSDGERNFSSIAIVGGRKGILTDYCPPCGVCRQVMTEFCDPKTFRILLAKSVNEYKVYTLNELFPIRFGAENL